MANVLNLPVPGRPRAGGQSAGRPNPYFGKKPTQQQKMVNVNDALGNKAISKMQGSTRIVYDFIELDGRTLFEFFLEVNTKKFPFANMQEGKLQVGESLTIERAYLAMIVTDAETGNVVSSMELNQAGLSNLYRSDLSFHIDNSRVVKPINVQSFQPQFNRRSNWGAIAVTADAEGVATGTTLVGNAVFHTETDIIIPSLIEFQANLKTDGYTPIANAFLGLVIEGTGSILNPRRNY
jgi:hypothetical protein